MNSIRTGIILSAILVFAASAQADEYYEFAHPICAPELGYFRLQRVGVYNPPHNGPYISEQLNVRQSAVKSLREKAVLFTGKELKSQPYACRIPGNPYKSGWDNWRPKIDVGLEATSSVRINVTVNGERVEEMILGGDRVFEEIDSISVVHNGVNLEVTTCIEKELPGPERIVCTSREIQKAELEKAQQASMDADWARMEQKRTK